MKIRDYLTKIQSLIEIAEIKRINSGGDEMYDCIQDDLRVLFYDFYDEDNEDWMNNEVDEFSINQLKEIELNLLTYVPEETQKYINSLKMI